MSLRAQELAIKQLTKLKDEGHLSQEVINQSIMNGWAGLFPIKKNNDAGKPYAKTKSYIERSNEGFRKSVKDSLDEFYRTTEPVPGKSD